MTHNPSSPSKLLVPESRTSNLASLSLSCILPETWAENSDSVLWALVVLRNASQGLEDDDADC